MIIPRDTIREGGGNTVHFGIETAGGDIKAIGLVTRPAVRSDENAIPVEGCHLRIPLGYRTVGDDSAVGGLGTDADGLLYRRRPLQGDPGRENQIDSV